MTSPLPETACPGGLKAGLLVLLFFLTGLFAPPSAWAAVPARKKPSRPAPARAVPAPAPKPLPPEPSCERRLHQLIDAYEGGKAEYLGWDMARAGCSDEELYEAFYHQGLGAFLLSQSNTALDYFKRALALQGPRDEEILRIVYDIYGRKQDHATQDMLLSEFYRRYPSSPYLYEMLTAWQNRHTPAPKPKPWSFSFTQGYRKTPTSIYDRHDYLSTAMKAAYAQSLGSHHFQGQAALSGSSLVEPWRFRNWVGVSQDLEAQYRFKGFAVTAAMTGNWPVDTVGIGQDTRFLPRLGAWEPSRGKIALSQAWSLPAFWGLKADASMSRTRDGIQLSNLGVGTQKIWGEHFLMGNLSLTRFSVPENRFSQSYLEPSENPSAELKPVRQVIWSKPFTGNTSFTTSFADWYYYGKALLGLNAYHSYIWNSFSDWKPEDLKDSTAVVRSTLNEEPVLREHSLGLGTTLGYDLFSWLKTSVTLDYRRDFISRAVKDNYSVSAETGISF